MKIIFPFLIIIYLTSPTIQWYSRCDQAGSCTISLTETGEGIYLVPGYLPFYPDGEVKPVKSNSTVNSFTVESLTGFSKNGPLNGKDGYECAGGFSECVNSCCKNGFCKGTQHDLEEKKDKAKLIYIITGAIFFAFIIFYWIVFFVYGCNYNKKAQDEMKNRQDYVQPNFLKNKNVGENKQEEIAEEIKGEVDYAGNESAEGDDKEDVSEVDNKDDNEIKIGKKNIGDTGKEGHDVEVA